jgi:hypothetical protein
MKQALYLISLPPLIYLLVSYSTHLLADTHGLHSIHTGLAPSTLSHLFSLCPKLARGPIPPKWIPHNPHAQFPLFLLQGETHQHIYPIAWERHNFTVQDVTTNNPDFTELVSVDIWPPVGSTLLPANAPVIHFQPGLRCHSGDIPGSTAVRRAYMAGYRSVVFNRRGHGHVPGVGHVPLTSPRFNLFGDTGDLEQAYVAAQRASAKKSGFSERRFLSEPNREREGVWTSCSARPGTCSLASQIESAMKSGLRAPRGRALVS